MRRGKCAWYNGVHKYHADPVGPEQSLRTNTHQRGGRARKSLARTFGWPGRGRSTDSEHAFSQGSDRFSPVAFPTLVV